jgi:hypothetical protein
VRTRRTAKSDLQNGIYSVPPFYRQTGFGGDLGGHKPIMAVYAISMDATEKRTSLILQKFFWSAGTTKRELKPKPANLQPAPPTLLAARSPRRRERPPRRSVILIGMEADAFLTVKERRMNKGGTVPIFVRRKWDSPLRKSDFDSGGCAALHPQLFTLCHERGRFRGLRCAPPQAITLRHVRGKIRPRSGHL